LHDGVVLVELGAVIFGLAVLGRVAGRFGLSPIPLYLLAGLAFGQGGLAPLTTSESFVEVGAEIGVILLLLLLGLEYSASELVTNLRQQGPAGVMDLVLNAAPGVAIALILGWPLPAVVAMGGVTYATSSGITAKLIADLGRLGNRETPVILSLLVLEDLTMAAYLPILTALLAGAGLVSGAISLGIALVAVGVALVVALRFGKVINRLVFSGDNEILLLGVFGLALLVAGVATNLQVSDAVGAFLVGIALSGKVAENARQLLLPLRDLFAAVFFVFFGLSTDPTEIPAVLPAAIALALVTIVTKVFVGWWAAYRAGIGLRGRVRAGTVIVSRGEFNIVIAGLASTAAVEPALGPLAAAYVMLMAIIGPVIARLGEPLAKVAQGFVTRRRTRAAEAAEAALEVRETSPVDT
jgi:CPA2 family monovalent cation:H+ antiporter-2